MKAIQTVFLTAENITRPSCYLCSGQGEGIWMLVGYDEFGELWICSPCWEVHHSDEDLLPENGIKS